jgi:hypothetical protein
VKDFIACLEGLLRFLKGVVVWALVLPAMAWAATPSEGVELKVRRGFFTETDIGAFFTLGGDQSYSNAETYLQLGIGYDLNELFEFGLTFGIGASAADCFAGRKNNDPNADCLQAENFTMAMLDASVAYLWRVLPRLFITPKVLAGYTNLQPAPVLNSAKGPYTDAMNVGGGLGVEYETSLDHFSIGFEVSLRYVIGPNIPAISIFPRVKYTF